jgi:hypothetical protein
MLMLYLPAAGVTGYKSPAVMGRGPGAAVAVKGFALVPQLMVTLLSIT